jgi:hypothetical protein
VDARSQGARRGSESKGAADKRNFSGSPLVLWDRNDETHGTAQSGTKNGMEVTRTGIIHNEESHVPDTGHVVVTGGTETRICKELRDVLDINFVII